MKLFLLVIILIFITSISLRLMVLVNIQEKILKLEEMKLININCTTNYGHIDYKRGGIVCAKESTK